MWVTRSWCLCRVQRTKKFILSLPVFSTVVTSCVDDTDPSVRVLYLGFYQLNELIRASSGDSLQVRAINS